MNLLAALDALLATGSVSTAARQMHLSPPAMSHALARIREVLGDPIFVRAGRKLVPTQRAVEMREPRSAARAMWCLLCPVPAAPCRARQQVSARPLL